MGLYPPVPSPYDLLMELKETEVITQNELDIALSYIDTVDLNNSPVFAEIFRKWGAKEYTNRGQCLSDIRALMRDLK